MATIEIARDDEQRGRLRTILYAVIFSVGLTLVVNGLFFNLEDSTDPDPNTAWAMSAESLIAAMALVLSILLVAMVWRRETPGEEEQDHEHLERSDNPTRR